MAKALKFTIPQGAVKVKVFLDDDGKPKAQFFGESGEPDKGKGKSGKSGSTNGPGITDHLRSLVSGKGPGMFADPDEGDDDDE